MHNEDETKPKPATQKGEAAAEESIAGIDGNIKTRPATQTGDAAAACGEVAATCEPAAPITPTETDEAKS